MTHPAPEHDGALDVPVEGDMGLAAGAPHRPADDSEEVYFEGSPMLRGEIGHVTLFGFLGVLCIALAVLAMVYDWGWPWWLLTICFVVALGLVTAPLLLVRTVRYRITNYRIDYERGLLSRQIDTLELWHVEDLRFHQSLMNRLLKVGTISVFSHDETTPRLDMRGIPRPRPVFDALKQRIIAVKRQRGVIKMDVG
jgi:membrane protein YdbS with pleckstrin-like domain